LPTLAHVGLLALQDWAYAPFTPKLKQGFKLFSLEKLFVNFFCCKFSANKKKTSKRSLPFFVLVTQVSVAESILLNLV